MGGGGLKKEQPSGGMSYDTKRPNPFDPKKYGQQIAGDIKYNYEQGPTFFDGPLYAGMGSGTKSTLADMLYKTGQGETGFSDANQFAKNAINAAGQPGIGEQNLSEYAKGSRAGQSGAMLRDFAAYGVDQAKAPGLAQQNLTSLAQGEMLGHSNPYREQILDDTRADIEASLGASGRFGSNTHMETLADRLSSIRGSFHDQDRALQMSAINQINAERGQNFNQGMAASSAVAALDENDFAQQLAAINHINAERGQNFNKGMAASAALPSLYQAQFMPQQTALSLNQMLDQNNQAQLMAEYDLFKRKKPSTHIAENISLLQMLNGNPGMEPEKNTSFGDFLGGAIGLGSLFL